MDISSSFSPYIDLLQQDSASLENRYQLSLLGVNDESSAELRTEIANNRAALGMQRQRSRTVIDDHKYHQDSLRDMNNIANI